MAAAAGHGFSLIKMKNASYYLRVLLSSSSIIFSSPYFE